jgi:hypothetical protein
MPEIDLESCQTALAGRILLEDESVVHRNPSGTCGGACSALTSNLLVAMRGRIRRMEREGPEKTYSKVRSVRDDLCGRELGEFGMGRLGSREMFRRQGR